MKKLNSRQTQAKILRIFRKVHRTTGAMLFIFFFIIAITGILLGWKSHSDNLIIPQSYKGSSIDLQDWLPIDSLHKKALLTLKDSISSDLSAELDRIDIRKNKGMVKFIFENHSRFKIDKNKVIAGGSSAGAEAVLSAVYMKDFYIENAQDFRDVKFAGLISLAGAMVNVNYLNEDNAIPTVLFHGTADTAVPFATAAHHYCKTDQAGYLILDGSETIVKRLKALNTSFYFHVEIDGHHGLSSIPFNSLEAILKFFKRTSSSSEIVQTTIIVEADQN